MGKGKKQQQEQSYVPCRSCGQVNIVPTRSGVGYQCCACRAVIVPASEEEQAGCGILFWILLLLIAAMTAAVSLFVAGIWDYGQFQQRVAAAWERSEEWFQAKVDMVSSANSVDDVAGAPTGWEVRMRNGTTFEAGPLFDALILETEFGELRVPIRDLICVVPGSEASVSLRRRIAFLIDQLGGADTETARSAAEKLVQIGPDAVPQLKTARSERELSVSRSAADILARIQPEQTDEVEPVTDDLIITRYFGVWGQLAEEAISVETESGQELIPWAELRRVNCAKWAPSFDGQRRPAKEVPKTFLLETEYDTWAGTLQPSELKLQTPYGTLNIPTSSIVALECQSDNTLQQAESTTLELLRAEDGASRMAAISQLAEGGSSGVLTLQRVLASDDEELRQAALPILTRLAEQEKGLAPLPFRVRTTRGDLGGVLGDQVLEIRTEMGDIKQLNFATILSIKGK